MRDKYSVPHERCRWQKENQVGRRIFCKPPPCMSPRFLPFYGTLIAHPEAFAAKRAHFTSFNDGSALRGPTSPRKCESPERMFSQFIQSKIINH